MRSRSNVDHAWSSLTSRRMFGRLGRAVGCDGLGDEAGSAVALGEAGEEEGSTTRASTRVQARIFPVVALTP
jgi:hypothetical protein